MTTANEYLSDAHEELVISKAFGKRICANCVYWSACEAPTYTVNLETDKLFEDSLANDLMFLSWVGLCHRYPPLIGGEDCETYFPSPEWSSWCGELKMRDDKCQKS